MSILWCGGEDIDFSEWVGGVVMSTTATYFRSGYARAAVDLGGNGNQISTRRCGISLTPRNSVWVSWRLYIDTTQWQNGYKHFQLMSSGNEVLTLRADTNAQPTLYIGNTLVASSSLAMMGNLGVRRIDLNISLGSAGVVQLYVDGTKIIDWTGNTVYSTLDQMRWGSVIASVSGHTAISELIVANEDTRLMSLVTHSPTAVGDANAWTQTTTGTNGYQDINEIAMDDSKVWYTDTNAQDSQIALSDLPTGKFQIKAFKSSARASKSADATMGSIAPGVKSNGTVNVSTPSACTTAWATIENVSPTNPTTGQAFTMAEINALQLDYRSGT